MAEENRSGFYSEAGMPSQDLPWDLHPQQPVELRRHSYLPLSAADDFNKFPPQSHAYRPPAGAAPSSSPSSNSQGPPSAYGMFHRGISANFASSSSPPGSPGRGATGVTSQSLHSNAYKLNLSPRDMPENMASPRVSDVGGLSRFLPSNNEPNEDDLTAWAGALKGLTGGAGGGVPVSDVSVYSSDEFRMYEFKVRRCMRGRSHDWTDCPFAHPGEKARRRDPRKYHYSGTACPDFRKGACRRGDACEFAHGVFECWLHPARYRTQPCKDGRNCKRRVCFFAHTPEQLRLLPAAAMAASQTLPQEAATCQSSATSADPKLGGPTRLSPTSTLAGPTSSPGITPPLTPEASPPSSPSHADNHFAPMRSASWGPSAAAAQSPSSHLGQFNVQVPSSPRHYPGSLSPRAAPTWGSPFSSMQTGSSAINAMPPTATSSRNMGGNAQNASNAMMMTGVAGAALRQRHMERFHSLPALAIPAGLDSGPLSVSSPYAASPSHHHRLALMQAAAAAANASCHSPAGSSPMLSSRGSLVSPSQFSDQQAASTRAMLISELVASLQALDVQHPGTWMQAQQDVQVRQAHAQAQARAQAKWLAEAQAQGSVQARAEAQAQALAQSKARMEQMQFGQVMAGNLGGRVWNYADSCEAEGQFGPGQQVAGRWEGGRTEGECAGSSAGRESNGNGFGGKEEGGAEGQDGSDLAWVNNLVKDEGGPGSGGSQEGGMNNSRTVGAADPWADAGHWVSTAHA